ncbi:hypothetical protein WJX77_000413 [Trebouxia sp. C0004]
MSALSTFGWQMQADREDLCSRLVCKLLPVQAEGSNHGLAMDYCLQNLEQHRFGDVDPASVESLYGGLSERLGSHSQLQKQRALQKLVAALLDCKLDSQQLEPHHNLLSLVYWLARRPLESAYIPSEKPSGIYAGSPESELSDDDHESDWGNDAAVYSSDSELSDWEEPRDTHAAYTDSQSHSQAVKQTGADAEPQQSSSPLDLIKQLRQKLAVHLPKPQQMSRLHTGCLLLSIAAAQGSEDTLPPATHCTSEAELAQQVVRMLRGAQDPGPAFRLDRGSGSFTANSDTHVPHLSHSSLHHMLGSFAATGTDLLKLQTFVNKVQSAVSSQSWQASRAQSSVSPTLAAFAAALADQMHPMWAKLVEIEQSLGITETSIKVSLLHLEYQLQGVLRRIGLLKHVWEEVLGTEDHSRDRPVTAAQLSCDLLTKLKSMLHHYSLQGGPRGSQEAAVLLRIWKQSMQPLLAALQAWLYDGLLQGSPFNFFICEDQNVSVDSPYFWNEAFTLRRTASGDVACPNFLQPLVEGILSTGKSLILLRAHQDLHTRTSAASPSLQGGATPSNSPTSKLRAIAANSAKMQGATANGSSSLEAAIANRPGLGQMMAQSQASWQPLAVGTWPLIASSAPSAAAYSMPMHHSRHRGLHTPSAARPHAGCYQQHIESQSQSEVLTGRSTQSSHHDSAVPGSEHIVGFTQTAHLAPRTQLSDTSCPSNLDNRVVHLPLQHVSQGGLPHLAPARSHVAQLLHQIDTDPVENMQQAGMHAAEAGLASGCQQASVESGILDHQQQQQSVRADSSVLEWCSRADELLQLSAAPGEAVPMQASFPGSLPIGLNILPAYSGRGMFSMSQQPNDKWEEDRRWLQGLQNVDLPPVDHLLDECLIQPIQEQVDMVGGVLLARLLGEWGLMHQLTILRNVFLLGCPLLMPFASALYGRLHKGQKLSSLSHFELEVMLQQSLADQPPHRPGDHALPPPNTLSVELVHQNPSASMSRASSSGEGCARCNVAELLPLRLHYRVPWPLSIIVDDATLVKYNQVLTFLLQVRWAKWSLERVRVKAGRGEAGRPLEHGDVLAHQLSHFVNTLHQFVMDRLLHGAWLALEQALEGAKSLEEVKAAHSRFVVAVQRQCLLAPDKTWKLIEGVVVQILNQVLQFADLQQKLRTPGTKVSVADVRAELEALDAKFKDRHRYLLKVLTAKTLKISWQSELHYLVMRVNFNDFHGKSDDHY